MINRKKRGFTLIELIIVMTIIGILTTVSLVGYSSAKMKSRDAKRKADISSISGALAMKYSDTKSYPCSDVTVNCSITSSSKSVTSHDAVWNTTFVATLSPYVSTLPIDPVNNSSVPWAGSGNSFAYAYRSDKGVLYDLTTNLENHSDQDRCEIRDWRVHNSNDVIHWCGSVAPTNGASLYLFADH